MNTQQHQPETKRPPANSQNTQSMSGLVIMAIGIQLLLCSAASAANVCSGTIDRIEHSFVHALREISDRHAIQSQPAQIFEPGYKLSDCTRRATSTASLLATQYDLPIGVWLLNLPPPAMG